jgi:hypothetical protein
MPFTVDPIRKYENVNGVCIVDTAIATLAVSNNNLLVAATPGYRVRIMNWVIQSDGATVGSFVLKSNSGGSAITSPLTAPASTGGTHFILPNNDTGYMQTAVGHGLYVDVMTAGMVFNIGFIRYIS